MSIIYCICTILLLISAILIKKTQKKLDIVKTITITLVLFLCYQTFISYVFTILQIPITLASLTIINGILVIAMISKIFYKRQVQEYYFEKKDLIFIVLLLVIVMSISYLDFGFPFNIKYITTDSSIHYISAREFYENESLLLKVENIETANAMMPGAYSNIGILFKIFAPLIGEMNLYNIFIGFDIFILFLSGMLFFVTIKRYVKNNITYVLAGIISIIYLLGYPLNNMLFGYFYLGLGVLCINAIIAIMQEWGEEKTIWKNAVSIFLLCFELFFSYYLFVPPVYGAIFIYYIFYFHKEKGRWFNKSVVVYTLITLVVPTVIGFLYHVLPGMLSTSQIQVTNAIQLEGYIYRNLYSNVLLFIPFMIYYLVKEKKLQFDIISIIVFVMYMCVLYIGIFKLNISTYYFFKTYFVLWQFVIYLFFRGICYIAEKKNGQVLVCSYVSIYILLMIISFFVSNVQITKDTFNKNEKITDVMDIYGINKTVLTEVEIDFTKEELEILEYIKQNSLPLKNNNTLIIGNQRQEYWFYALIKYKFKDNLNYATTINYINNWNKGDYEYLVYFNCSNYYEIYKNDIELDGSEVIFENSSGGIIRRSRR
jgi:hypothetical protein